MAERYKNKIPKKHTLEGLWKMRQHNLSILLYLILFNNFVIHTIF